MDNTNETNEEVIDKAELVKTAFGISEEDDSFADLMRAMGDEDYDY